MAHQEGRMQAAALNARAAYARVRRKAEAITEELEEITSPNFAAKVVEELDEEDSMVIAVDRVIAVAKGG